MYNSGVNLYTGTTISHTMAMTIIC